MRNVSMKNGISEALITPENNTTAHYTIGYSKYSE